METNDAMQQNRRGFLQAAGGCRHNTGFERSAVCSAGRERYGWQIENPKCRLDELWRQGTSDLSPHARNISPARPTR